MPSSVRTMDSEAKEEQAACSASTRPQRTMFVPRYSDRRERCCARYCVGNSAARKPGFGVVSK